MLEIAKVVYILGAGILILYSARSALLELPNLGKYKHKKFANFQGLLLHSGFTVFGLLTVLLSLLLQERLWIAILNMVLAISLSIIPFSAAFAISDYGLAPTRGQQVYVNLLWLPSLITFLVGLACLVSLFFY